MYDQKTLQLSPLQRELCAIERLVPPGPWMNMARACRLAGTPNLEVLREAVWHVVQRHDLLRTRFHLEHGRLKPEIISVPRDVLRIEDISLPMPSAASSVSVIETEVNEPFVLDRDLPFRTRLFRLADGTSIVTLTAHHIVVDGYSLGVLIGEIAEYYNSVTEGRTHRLPDPVMQYSEYIAKSTPPDPAFISNEVHFWTEVVRDAPTFTRLPFDYDRPEKQTELSKIAVVELSSDLSNAVFALAKKRLATAFTVCLSGFMVLVERLSNQTDFLIGIAAGTRPPRAANVVGPLVQSVLVRYDPPEDRDTFSFGDLTKRTFRQTLDGISHSKLSFGQLRKLIPSLACYQFHPLQIATTYLSFRLSSPTRFGPIDAEFFPCLTQGALAAHDLSLILCELPANKGTDNTPGLQIHLRYRPDLFKSSTIDRIVVQFIDLLRDLLRYPDQPLRRVGS